MNSLNVALIQTGLHWHDAEANRQMFEERIAEIQGSPDLIVLPEMFNTGFTSDFSQAEPIGHYTYQWLGKMAAQTGAVIMGTMLTSKEGVYYNRMIMMYPDGNHFAYDKRHLFRMGDELDALQAGEEQIIIDIKGWKVCPMICYDLRFPAWSRNAYNEEKKRLDYDVLVYAANWPSVRTNLWDILLRARAIENQAYVVGVNRLGVDGNNIAYDGHSAIIDAYGNSLAMAAEEEQTLAVSLDDDALKKYRDNFPAYLDNDEFTVKGQSKIVF